MMSNNGNPMPLIQQIMGNSSPEFKKQILTRAKELGAPDNILSQVQNFK
jgi:hypothetical protein